MAVPYYPGSLYTPNLSLALYSVDSEIAGNFVILDSAFGSGGSVNVNGSLVLSPNFNGTLPAAPGGKSNVTFQVDGNGNISAYYTAGSAGGVTSITGDSVVYNNAASTGAVTLSLISQTANTVLAGPSTGANATPTFRALVAADLPSGTGTVTSFSAGALSPLFTTSVATATTTPALTFSLSNAAGGTVFGNATASAAAPVYTTAPVLGIPGTSTGTIALSSNGGGLFTLTAPSGQIATPTLTLPITSNTLAGQLLGDGTIFASSPIVTATLAGTLILPTPKAQVANTFFAGPTSGGNAAPTYRALVAADIPSGTVIWNAIGNAAGNLTLANAGNTTTFNQTSAVAWLWANTQAAISGTAQSSPLHELAGSSWSGAAAVTDTWTIQNVCASSTTVAGTSELKILHTGTTGSSALDVAKVTYVNGTTGGPFVQGGYGFDGTKETGSSTPDMICGEGSGIFSFVPSSSTSINVGARLRLYSNAATTTNSLTWEILSGQNNAAGDVNLIVQAGLNASGSIMTFLAGPGTYAGRAAIQFGAVPSGNAINFSATSGSQVCMAIGGIAAGSGGSVQFNPASGTATFTGLNIAPIINQTSTASGSYTALQIAVTETSLKGSANKFLTMQGGSSGTTTSFEINNSGIIDNYNAIATVSNGVPSELAKSDLTAQSAAITATTLYATTATGMYRVSWSATITTADGVSSVLGGSGGFQVLYTSPTDSVVKTTVSGNSVTSAANTTGTAVGGCEVIYSKTGTNIQFQYGYTSATPGQMVFEIHIKVEAL